MENENQMDGFPSADLFFVNLKRCQKKWSNGKYLHFNRGKQAPF